MAKAEFGTAKWVGNQMKAKGLQKLKFYCQVCEKQCRDDNGFKAHIKAPSHLRRIAEATGRDLENYSREFEKTFLMLLRMSHGEKKINANKFYNEFIQDKNHVHMNSTRWSSLAKFVGYLGKSGKVRVSEDDENNLEIAYIDNSFESVLRNERLQEMQAADKSEEALKQALLTSKIEAGASAPVVEETAVDPTTSVKPIKMAFKVTKPLPKKNVFKKK